MYDHPHASIRFYNIVRAVDECYVTHTQKKTGDIYHDCQHDKNIPLAAKNCYSYEPFATDYLFFFKNQLEGKQLCVWCRGMVDTRTGFSPFAGRQSSSKILGVLFFNQ